MPRPCAVEVHDRLYGRGGREGPRHKAVASTPPFRSPLVEAVVRDHGTRPWHPRGRDASGRVEAVVRDHGTRPWHPSPGKIATPHAFRGESFTWPCRALVGYNSTIVRTPKEMKRCLEEGESFSTILGIRT